MTDANVDRGPAPSAYDGWAVVDLDAQTLVYVNDRARRELGSMVANLPVALRDVVSATDLTLLTNRVFPLVRSGQTWSGGLRLGEHQVVFSPGAAMFVPHRTAADGGQLEFASLLFSTSAAIGAVSVPDPLTGLPTRTALLHRLTEAVHRNRESNNLLAVLFVDLDGLKTINDRYGHEVGDAALVETAQRISAHLPAGAMAARFGGDEFVIVHEDASDLDQAEALATQILSGLNTVGDYHAISASVGIAVSRTGEVEAHELIRRADGAMYRAKARGGSQLAIFDAQMRSAQRDDEKLRSSLLHAIANNGFGVAAQPIFELATGRIHAVELFIRVRDDTPYISSAHQLFRLAHEYGEALDAAVLGRALALAHTWQKSLDADAPRVHINISSQSLAASQFTRRVEEALASSGLRSGAIAFEIDGRDLASSGERERTTIAGLQQLGVPIIADGFGNVGFSLEQLARLRPAMVKLPSDTYAPGVLAGLIRAVSTLVIPTCVKSISTNEALRGAVKIGAFAGQGNALTPVRQVERVNALVHGPPRIGF